MAVSLTIGGISYQDYVDITTVHVEDQAEAVGDAMDFHVVLDSTALTSTPGVPKAGQICSLIVDGIKHFEGVITSVDQVLHSSRDSYRFECQASDYTYLLSSRLVTDKIGAGDAGAIVTNLVNTYAPGFGTRHVQLGYTVPEDEFDHQELGSVINKYAEAVGFYWYVDFDRELHFKQGGASFGPLSFIDLDTDNRLGDVNILEDASQIKNRVYVKDATTKSAEKRRDTFVSSDNQSFFKLFSPPFDAESAEVFKNGNPVTVFEDTLTTQDGEIEGAENTCFMCLINSGLRFPLNDLPEQGDVIEADYFPEEGGGEGGLVIVLEDPDSIRMMRQRESASGYLSSGVHETIVSAPQLRVANLDPLAYLGGIVLDRYAWPELSGSISIADPAIQGWKAGQTFQLSSAKRNLYSAKDFWRYGLRRDPWVHIQGVSKRFTPYESSEGTVNFLFEEKIIFSSITGRLTI